MNLSCGGNGSAVDTGPGTATVLVVDDEPRSLDLLRRTLHGAYRVLQAPSGVQGLLCLEGHPVAAVIADQRMPGMTGVEFLAESWRRFPRTERILLTGYTEMERLIDAVNAGRIFGYLAKPWHPEELLCLLRRAVETHHLREERERLLNDLRARNEALTRLLEKTRRLQEEKIQAERWSALGKLAAMVAHDLRSPLAAIQCQAGLLQDAGPCARTVERATRAIAAQVGKMREYIDELLLVSGPPCAGAARRPYEIPALLVSLQEAFSQRCARAGVRLVVDQGFRGTCEIQPTQIYRAMENILQNALESCPRGGTILVRSEQTEEGALLIRVADSGAGVPEAVRGTLFEPFSTWGKSGGTGLGLAVVDKVVREHGGRVWEEGWRLPGACFHVLLPADPSAPGVSGGCSDTAERPRGEPPGASVPAQGGGPGTGVGRCE